MKIEIWSDIVCPFCYIGKRRFESALARFPGRDGVQVVRRSFELDPGAPSSVDGTLNEILAHKKGISVARAAELSGYVTALAAREGLDYHLDRARSGNTFDAHRLIHLATERGLGEVVEERLLRAYFTDGLPIGDHETLVALGVECGLDGNEVRTMLSGTAYSDNVQEDERRAASLGIHGVPFFLIDGQYAISGAQDVATFLDALEQAAKAGPLASEEEQAAGVGVCDEDGCTVDSVAEPSVVVGR